jgi:hypothetical protein
MNAAELRKLADQMDAESAKGPSGACWKTLSNGTMWTSGHIIVGVSGGRYRAQVYAAGSWVAVDDCDTADAALAALAAEIEAAAAMVREAVK